MAFDPKKPFTVVSEPPRFDPTRPFKLVEEEDPERPGLVADTARRIARSTGVQGGQALSGLGTLGEINRELINRSQNAIQQGVFGVDSPSLKAKQQAERERVPLSATNQATAQLGDFISQAANEAYNVDKTRDDTFIAKLADSAGSLPVSLATGPMAPIAYAAMMAKQGYDDAVQKLQAAGETDPDKIRGAAVNAALLNAGLGAVSEKLLGVPAMFKSIRGMAGKTTPSRVAIQGGKGFLREGAQEGIEQAGQNVIAKDIVGYDPERARTEGVGEAALLGGFMGGPTSAAFQGAQEYDARKGHQDYAKYLDTEKNVPEATKTLLLQQDQLLRGLRPAQMFPKGTNELPLPDGLERVETERGTFHFNPEQTNADNIIVLSKLGRENEILNLGPYSKPEIEALAKKTGEPIITTEERAQDGTEIRATVGTPSTAEAQRAAMEANKSPGSTITTGTPGQTVLQRLRAADAEIQAQVKAAQEKEQKARADRQADLAAKKARFDETLVAARTLAADPQAEYSAINGAVASLTQYAEDNSLGLTLEQRQEALAELARLQPRLDTLRPAFEAQKATAEEAAKRQAKLDQDAKMAKIRQENARIDAIEATGRDPQTGRIEQIEYVPDEELNAIDLQAEGISEDAYAKELQRRERAAAEENVAGYTLRDLFVGRKDKLAAAGLKAPLRLPTPETERQRGGLGGELAVLQEGGVPWQYFKAEAKGLDNLAETLRGLGFQAETESEALALVERAFAGQDVKPQGAEFAQRVAPDDAKFYWRKSPLTKDKREWTPGREAAAQRAVKREADEMALFPEMRRVNSVEERRNQMDQRTEEFTTRVRNVQAQAWRNARQALRELSPEMRRRVLAKWNAGFMPATGANLMATIAMEQRAANEGIEFAAAQRKTPTSQLNETTANTDVEIVSIDDQTTPPADPLAQFKGQAIKNNATNATITITRDSVRKPRNTLTTPLRRRIAAQLPRLIQTAVPVASETDNETRPNIAEVLRFVASAQSEGKIVPVRLTARKDSQGKTYLHHVEILENEAKGAPQAAQTTAKDQDSSALNLQRTIKVRDLLPNVKEAEPGTYQADFATTPQAEPAQQLSDAEIKRQFKALRKALGPVAQQYDLQIGLVADLLEAEGYRREAAAVRRGDLGAIEAATAPRLQNQIDELRQQQRFIVVAVEAVRQGKLSGLVLHELAHPFFDRLPDETKAALRKLHAHETSTKTGPLYQDGKLTTNIAISADQLPADRVASDPDLPVKEWFAERLRKLNEDWINGRMKLAESPTLVRVWREFMDSLRRIFAQIRGINQDADLFTDTFRQWIGSGTKADISEAATAYAQGLLQIDAPLGLGLPNEIRNLIPKWQDKTLRFESNLDKALYYAGTDGNTETRDRVREHLAEQTGLSQGQIATLARELRQRLRNMAPQAATNGELRVEPQMRRSVALLTGIEFAAKIANTPATQQESQITLQIDDVNLPPDATEDQRQIAIQGRKLNALHQRLQNSRDPILLEIYIRIAGRIQGDLEFTLQEMNDDQVVDLVNAVEPDSAAAALIMRAFQKNKGWPAIAAVYEKGVINGGTSGEIVNERSRLTDYGRLDQLQESAPTETEDGEKRIMRGWRKTDRQDLSLFEIRGTTRNELKFALWNERVTVQRARGQAEIPARQLVNEALSYPKQKFLNAMTPEAARVLLERTEQTPESFWRAVREGDVALVNKLAAKPSPQRRQYAKAGRYVGPIEVFGGTAAEGAPANLEDQQKIEFAQANDQRQMALADMKPIDRASAEWSAAFDQAMEEFYQGARDSVETNPRERVSAEDQARIDGEVLTPAAAKARVNQWKEEARKRGKNQNNSDKIILSLFDSSGVWSQPWRDAGYTVVQIDQNIVGGDGYEMDILDVDQEWLMDNGLDMVHGVLAACPCTEFAGSGARWFKIKDADGRTEKARELVHHTLAIIEYLQPDGFWAIENPVGRIKQETEIPTEQLQFQPHNYGDPYTKRTQIFGMFNPNLPQANVAPTEGSYSWNLSGTAKSAKAARSKTFEGFAYSFFMANKDRDARTAAEDYADEQTGQVEFAQAQSRRDQTDTPEFKAWFKASKVVDAEGKPLRVYHGSKRADRIDNRFKKNRATSGPMAFFTSDPAIASNYATGKEDTSLETPSDYSGWFKFKAKGMRSPVSIDQAWWSLSQEQRDLINQRIYTIGYQDADQATGPIVATSQSIMPKDSIAYELRQARGNSLRALVEIWLNSGALYNSEEEFMDVLKAAGLDPTTIEYDSPWQTRSGVFPVYLSIQNPLNTAEIPEAVIQQLAQAGSRKRAKTPAGGNPDQWDKNSISGRDWIQALKEDQGKNTTHAWTRIPDWVTEKLRELGYDGIQDSGGKMGGQSHAVWIPFDENQVKSATGNRGTFSTDNNRIDFATSQKGQEPDARSQRLTEIDARLAELNNGTNQDTEATEQEGQRLSEERRQLIAEMHEAEQRAIADASLKTASEIEAEASEAAKLTRHSAAQGTVQPGEAWAPVATLTPNQLQKEREKIQEYLNENLDAAKAEQLNLHGRIDAIKAEEQRRQDPISAAPRVTPIQPIDRKAALLAELQRGRQMRDEGMKTGAVDAEQEGLRIVRQATERLNDEFTGWDQQSVPNQNKGQIENASAPKPASSTQRDEDDGRNIPPAPPVEPPENGPAFQDEPAPNRGRAKQLYGHSAHQPTWLESNWEKLKKTMVGIRGAVPELPTFPAAKWNKSDRFIQEQGAGFYNGLKEFWRTLRSGNDYIQRTAEEQVGAIVEPLLKIGGKFSADDYRRLQRLQEKVRVAQAEKKLVSPRMLANLAGLQSRMESHPYVLFNRLVLLLDLEWRYKNLKDSQDNPIKMPLGLNGTEIEEELNRIDGLIAASPHKAAIETAIDRHREITKQIYEDLKFRDLFAAQHLSNTSYFPHLTLEITQGDKVKQRELQPERVRPGTEADFRGYLIDPVGSTKPIETDYVRAMYYHLVQVGAHNFKADAIRNHARPYDVMAEVQARAKELSKQRGVSVSWEQVYNEEYAPRGYVLYGTDSRDAFPTLQIDRDKLARRLGIELTSEDIHQQLATLGLRNVKLLPEDLTETLQMGQRETWIVPSRVAEALRGIADRQNEMEVKRSNAMATALGYWKAWKLFTPQNHIRYEFNNIVADAEKILSASPRTLLKLTQAAKEIRAFYLGGKPNDDLRAALKDGVINAITAQEMGQLQRMRAFEKFQTLAQRLQRAAIARTSSAIFQPITNPAGLGDLSSVELSAFRESVTRYANYLANLEAIRNGARPAYAGAYWRDIEAIQDSRPGAGDRAQRQAAQISKATFGDYGDLSVNGEWLRRNLVPFYSWMEVNFKYHANLLRNLRDMVNRKEITRGKATGQAAAAIGAAAAGLGARTAAGVAIRLALPYAAVALWNTIGGPMAGAWDDDDDLEKELSEEDRRRFHIILGRDAQGNVRVLYGATALADVMKWFSGPKFMQSMGNWLQGRSDFATAVNDWSSQIAPDLLNIAAGSLGPVPKIAVAATLRKNTFPDVTEARTIPAYDLRRTVLSQMTDDLTADMVERLANKDYVAPKDLGTWATQLILQVRRRDPEAWAFYAIKDKAAEFQYKQTGERSGFADRDSPDQQVLRNFRRAIFKGDAQTASAMYLRLLDLGYTSERFAGSIRAQDPLSSLSKKDGLRQQFVASLDATDRQMLDRAYRYYAKLTSNRGQEAQLFPKDAWGQAGQQAYQAQPRTELLRRIMELQAQQPELQIQRRGAYEQWRSLQRN